MSKDILLIYFCVWVGRELECRAQTYCTKSSPKGFLSLGLGGIGGALPGECDVDDDSREELLEPAALAPPPELEPELGLAPLLLVEQLLKFRSITSPFVRGELVPTLNKNNNYFHLMRLNLIQSQQPEPNCSALL